jgi:hypothetical protein
MPFLPKRTLTAWKDDESLGNENYVHYVDIPHKDNQGPTVDIYICDMIL